MQLKTFQARILHGSILTNPRKEAKKNNQDVTESKN